MAEKTVDRRIQRTRQLLQDALLALILEKGFEAVTVQDVIDRANVGRSTFYAHFQDKEDLLLSGFEHLRAEFEKYLLSGSVTSDSPWALSLSMLQHAQSQRQLYKAFASKQGGNIALTHIQKYLTAVLYDHLKQQLSTRKKSLPPEIVTHYLASSFISLLTWWLDTDSTYTAEQMNEYYRRLVQPGIDAIFQ
ncbi:MAG: TetR/AcrR family transcriptional regulator [Thermoflexales bacterium]|nr:TetR/AcrR family transcriptional regulator [Thermoflexales bacterium]